MVILEMNSDENKSNDLLNEYKKICVPIGAVLGGTIMTGIKYLYG